MNDAQREGASQILTAIITGLGLAMAPLEFFIVICVSLSTAVIVSRERPKSSRRNFWNAVLNALCFAILGAIVQTNYLPNVPTEIAMIGGAVLSGFFLNIYVRVVTQLEDIIAEWAINSANGYFKPRKKPDDNGEG